MGKVARIYEEMQSIVVVMVALVSVARAQMWLLPGDVRNPFNDIWVRSSSQGRDVTWSKPAGGGNVFGTLGSNNQGLFGTAGYKKTIFNDAWGKLEGQAYGNRMLGPAGDSSHLGGKLDFANDNVKATLDISKQIHGKTTVEASGAGVWNVDLNTQVSAGGAVSQHGGGRPDVAVKAEIEHKF